MSESVDVPPGPKITLRFRLEPLELVRTTFLPLPAEHAPRITSSERACPQGGNRLKWNEPGAPEGLKAFAGAFVRAKRMVADLISPDTPWRVLYGKNKSGSAAFTLAGVVSQAHDQEYIWISNFCGYSGKKCALSRFFRQTGYRPKTRRRRATLRDGESEMVDILFYPMDFPPVHIEVEIILTGEGKAEEILPATREQLVDLERELLGTRYWQFKDEIEIPTKKPEIGNLDPDSAKEQARSDAAIEEKSYFVYRDRAVMQMESPQVIDYLENRYSRKALTLCGRRYPVSVLWKNTTENIHPDLILGKFDPTYPQELTRSIILGERDYEMARALLKRKLEKGHIKYEGKDYRMTGIDLSSNPPKLHGAFGLYYDNMLTQYAMEWELKKAVVTGGSESLEEILKPGTLPLREGVEACCGNPILEGTGRCAAITASTLVVFKRRNLGFYCIVRRRSIDVAVSGGMLHVAPAGMFESKNTQDPWSIEMNVWRELLEEVYNEREQHGSEIPELPDYIRSKQPIKLLLSLLERGVAEFSLTGLCCDLLNLRPEVCTVLFVPDPEFIEVRGPIQLNWEYEPAGPAGKVAIPWNEIDETLEIETARGKGFVASGAVCLALGREWVQERHGALVATRS